MERAKAIHSDQRGIAFIVTLWVVLAIASTALAFAHTTLFDNRRVANTVAAVQAEHAIAAARLYLSKVLAGLEDPGTVPDPEEYSVEAVPVGGSRFWLIGRHGREVDGGRSPAWGLADEGAKLNLNVATLNMLQALPGVTAEIAAAIIDWRDTDDVPSPGGAESETYMRQDVAYQSKNGPFETVLELLQVHGVAADAVFGQDVNLNGVLDAWEQEDVVGQTFVRSHDVVEEFGLIEFLTVHTRTPNMTGTDGDRPINVNGNNPQQLRDYLRETLGTELATTVMQRVRPGQSTTTSVLGFFLRSELEREQFEQIEARLTTSDDPYVTGKININTASAEVLECIPGIGEEKALAIISYRDSNSEQLESVCWLAEVLEREQAIEAGPYVATRTYQFSADVVALGPNDRGYRRRLMVFDVSGDDPMVIYSRDRTGLGWALGEDIGELEEDDGGRFER